MTDARASRVAAEALTALAPARRASRLNGEALLGVTPQRTTSSVRVEVLHASLAAGAAVGTVAATLPRLGARLAGTNRPVARAATLAATLPRLGATGTGTNTPPARAGALAANLPRLRAELATVEAPPRSGALRAALPPVRGALAGATGGGVLPRLTAELYGTVPLVTATNTAWANDGYTYTGTADADYDPPVADPPPHLHRQDVRRVHQSLPTPTLVRGRPQ